MFGNCAASPSIVETLGVLPAVEDLLLRLGSVCLNAMKEVYFVVRLLKMRKESARGL